MVDYRIRFCNELGDSTGHFFHVLQREIEIREVADGEQAVERAKQEFERLEGVANWRQRALIIECDEMS